ncbi:hypothetical protein V6N13_129061 [Hibiscus sabdariffa]|uniref:Uncharacterized protein n=1 Tax=Hibiscus sabdariffa TaxID=183260 RepID=A0ABR2SKB5_9ROSI
MCSSTFSDIIGRKSESLDDFSADEENIVHITKKYDVHLLDVDDVETIITNATKGNGFNVEGDVWSLDVARLGLRNDKLDWGYVEREIKQPVPNYSTYVPSEYM